MTSLGGIYWCHQCNRPVTPTSTDELICPICGGSFLEEIESPGASDFPAAGAHDAFGFGGGEMDGGDRFDAPGGVPAGFRRFQSEGRGMRGHTGRSGGHPAVLQVLEAMSAVLPHMQLPQMQPPPGDHGSGEVDTSGFRRPFSTHLPWFRPSAPPPAPAIHLPWFWPSAPPSAPAIQLPWFRPSAPPSAPAPGPGPSSGGRGAGNQSSGNGRNGGHPVLD